MPQGRVFGGGSRPILDIRPDSPFVVFYGERAESQDAELTGKLFLHAPESMSVRSIKLTLQGVRKVSWNTSQTVTPQPIVSKNTFLHETQNIFPADGSKKQAHKINAGVHEWAFKFPMPGSLDESVEGLGTNWIVYNLTATLDRGYMSKQLTAQQHIRVIRTLGRDLMETLPMEQINEDIWANKLTYKITVPQKNYIVGTNVMTDFVLIPLRKGVEIKTIKMELIETRQLFCDYAGRRISNSQETVVAHTEGDMPENSAHTVPQDVADADHHFDEAHRFSMSLALPKSLKSCRQSVDTENIRLSHKLKLYINLHNPEGHTSQLLVKNHVHLFISPNLPPNEDQSVVVDPNILTAAAMRDEAHQNAPPTYGLHQLDELYNDIDPSGFMTPGGHNSMMNSGATTPFYGHSRVGSAENLGSLDAVADGASAAALHNRLHHLSMDQNQPLRLPPSRHHSSGGSTPRSGPDDALHEPPRGYFPADGYDMEALARTPSYNTAVRTPAMTPLSEDLPTYETATSRPSSPSRSPRSGNSTPSSARSLDTLTEETEGNTHLNSQRNTSMEMTRNSGDARPRTDSLSSESSSSPSSPPSSSSSTSSTSSVNLPSITITRTRSSSSSRSKPEGTDPQEWIRSLHSFRRVLRHVG